MADLHNQQPVIGVRLLSEGATLYNNRPVIGVRAATGLVFTDNQIVRGVEVIDDDRPLYNGQPVVGAVMIDDDRDLYNLQLVVPVEGLTPPFDPSILFANGEQGGLYDPSDLTTLFQDAAGTIPVTADGDPVGLMLDKHAWGGQTLEQVVAGQPELAPLPLDFATGWTLGAATGADVTITMGGATSNTYRGILTSGKTYAIEADVETSGCSVRLTNSTGPSLVISNIVSGTGTLITRFIAASSSLNFRLQNGSVGALCRVPRLTIREIPGNHAAQVATAARPTYRDIGGVRHLDSDGVDDALNITLPAGAYTRAYVTAAGVMTMDEGVSISGPEDIMRAPTVAGILYIDRALTSDEKSKLAAYWGATL